MNLSDKQTHDKAKLMAYGLTDIEAQMVLTPVSKIPKAKVTDVMTLVDKLYTQLIPAHNKAYVNDYVMALPEAEQAEYREKNKSYFDAH